MKKELKMLLYILCVFCCIFIFTSPVKANNDNSVIYKDFNVEITGTFVRSEVKQLLNLINSERKKAGVEKFSLDTSLSLEAEQAAVEVKMGSRGIPIYRGENHPYQDDYFSEVCYAHYVKCKRSNYNSMAEEIFKQWKEDEEFFDAMLREYERPVVGIGLFVQENDIQTYANHGMNSFGSGCILVSNSDDVENHYQASNLWPGKSYALGTTNVKRTVSIQAYGGDIYFPQSKENGDYWYQDGITLKVGEKKRVRARTQQGLFDGIGAWLDNSSGTWSSKNRSIATIDAQGNIRAIKEGTTAVRFKINNSSKKSYDLKIIVEGKSPSKKYTPSELEITKIQRKTSKTIKLSWRNKPGGYLPTQYLVYRSTKKSGGYKLVSKFWSADLTFKRDSKGNSIRSVTLNAAKGKHFYYKVRACTYHYGKPHYGKYSSAVKL